MTTINVHEQLGAKFLELEQMKKLKKLEIGAGDWGWRGKEKVKDMLGKNLPHLTIVEDRQKENFFVPAHPYAKQDRFSGFWEISCNRLSLF